MPCGLPPPRATSEVSQPGTHWGASWWQSPRPQAPAGRSGPERAKGPFKEAIVFVIGGGSYLERETIMTWAAKAGSSATGARQLRHRCAVLAWRWP